MSAETPDGAPAVKNNLAPVEAGLCEALKRSHA
jgi:hypothetical protein